ncbi:MAG: hypothetical protein ACE5EX_10385 [Phycisphaerae bacterium]
MADDHITTEALMFGFPAGRLSDRTFRPAASSRVRVGGGVWRVSIVCLCGALFLRTAVSSAQIIGPQPPPEPCGPTGTAICNDGNPCTDDYCVGGYCQHYPVPDGTECDDHNGCTEFDVCLDAVCVGDEIECDDGDPCTWDTCG